MATPTQTKTNNRRRAADSTKRPRAYRLFWRRRSASPWRREEFFSREEAFNRFFYLLARGVEIRWRTLEQAR